MKHHKIIVLILSVVVLAVLPEMINQNVETSAYGQKSSYCSISIRIAHTEPITYGGEKRENPGRSVYPGDAFHFIATIKWGEGCLSSVIKPIEVDGGYGVTLANQRVEYFQYVPHSGEHGWELERVRGGGSVEGSGHHLEDGASIKAFEKKVEKICSELEGDSACLYGHVEVNLNAKSYVCLKEEMMKRGIRIPQYLKEQPDQCEPRPNRLMIKAEGKYLSCSGDGNGGTRCTIKIAKRSTSYIQPVRDPSFPILFDYPPMLDLDKYRAKNDDGTYYVHDPATVHHMPDLLFREFRDKILVFKTTTGPTDLKKMQRVDCNDGFCKIVIKGLGMSPTTHDAKNGDGMIVYNATTFEELGHHKIRYTTILENIEREIYESKADAKLQIVDYNPVYSHTQEYLNFELTDGNSTYYSIAMAYQGSQGNGIGSGGKGLSSATNEDGDDEVYPDRRSKINYVHHTSIGEQIKFPERLNFTFSETHLGITSKGIIGNTTLILHGGEDITEMHPPQTIIDVIPEEWDKHIKALGKKRFSSLTNDTGLFYGKGFGRMLYTITPDIQKTALNNSFTSFTASNTPASVRFGGYDISHLFFEEHSFVPDNIYTFVNVTSIKHDGTINQNTDLNIKFISEPRNRTEYIPQYIIGHNHTNNINVTMMHVADLHDITNTMTGKGQVIMDANKTNVFIDSALNDLYDFRDPDNVREKILPLINMTSQAYDPEITDESIEKALKHTNTDHGYYILPEYFWHAANGAYLLEITANNIKNTISLDIVDFSTAINYTLNQDQKNPLKIASTLGVTTILSDEKFGNIVNATINGKKIETECSKGCFIIHESAGTHIINATNMWGGKASAVINSDPVIGVEKMTIFEQLREYVVNPYVVMTIILLLGIVIATKLWKAYQKY